MLKRKTISTLNNEEAPTSPDTAHLPMCSHGVALKFSREDKKSGIIREFYACSANRDRKLCPLFYWVDEWEKKLRRQSPQERETSAADDFVPRGKETRMDADLGVATYTDDSANSQFLFDAASIDLTTRVISTYLNEKNSARVLCIGTPTIHKALLAKGLDSLLLDEDARLGTFLPHTSRYNMFNGESYGSSLPDDSFSCIVIDPPFQPALIPALFKTLNQHFPKSLKGLLLLAFPYFNEAQILTSFDNLVKISDIRLTYRNHKKYVSGLRSPVRLFASVRIGDLLSDAEGYRFCKDCKDLKHESNKHCSVCNACTTIAGSRYYKHCIECNKCVKPDAVHDSDLNRCLVPRS
jgi:hypothetical protein